LQNSNIESQTKNIIKSSAQKFPKVISNSHVLIFCDIPLKINQLFFSKKEEKCHQTIFFVFCVPKLPSPLKNGLLEKEKSKLCAQINLPFFQGELV
jgi:hypothetical protein